MSTLCSIASYSISFSNFPSLIFRYSIIFLSFNIEIKQRKNIDSLASRYFPSRSSPLPFSLFLNQYDSSAVIFPSKISSITVANVFDYVSSSLISEAGSLIEDKAHFSSHSIYAATLIFKFLATDFSYLLYFDLCDSA